MLPAFSEARFELLYTIELADFWRRYLVDPPYATTNWEESWLGYDVSLNIRGFVYLVQFKLSELLTRKNAAEFKNGFSCMPYHRIKISNSAPSYQYDSLCRTLGRTIQIAGGASKQALRAEYVAPAFDEFAHANMSKWTFQRCSLEWLRTHSFNLTLRRHALRQRPSELRGVSTGEDHMLTVCTRPQRRELFSEPESVEPPFDYGRYAPHGFERRRNDEPNDFVLRDLLEALLRALMEDQQDLVERVRIADTTELSDVELLNAVRRLILTRHQAQMLVMSSTQLR